MAPWIYIILIVPKVYILKLFLKHFTNLINQENLEGLQR